MRKTLTIVAWMACAAFAVQAQDGPYKLVKEIQIGGEGGWDYLSVDSAAQAPLRQPRDQSGGRSTSRRTR